MDPIQLNQFKLKHKDRPAYCNSCRQWKPEKTIRRFLGKDVCYQCYKYMKNHIESLDIQTALEWIIGKFDVESDITSDDIHIKINIKLK